MSYILIGQFNQPGVGANVFFDALPDGLLLIWDGALYREDAVGSRTFSSITEDDGSGSAAAIRVSPGGSRIAFGSVGSTTILSWPALEQVANFEVPAYDLEWFNDEKLAVDGSAGVFLLNLDGTSTRLLVRAGDSAGVTFDSDGRLYTGDGFDEVGGTGTIKAFAVADWQRAVETGAPLDFATQGTEIAQLLSAGYLGFDNGNNLLVGGGTGGDDNYAAVITAGAVQDVLRGARPPITHDAPEADLQKLDPDPDAESFYYVNFNESLGELYLQAYGQPLIYVLRPA